MNDIIYYKSYDEIQLMKNSGNIVSKALGEVANIIDVGIKTIDIDRHIELFIKKHNAIPAFKGYHEYPYTLCISVNDQVVHGIPSNYIIKNGDIVSVDCGVIKDGFYADSAFTFPIGKISEKKMNLLKITQECLKLGINNAISGNNISDISFAIQQHAENNGYSVVKDLVGHGIGKNLHEYPEVPNFIVNDKKVSMKKGLVIAIEPMINIGSGDVYHHNDNWTILTKDGSCSAHYEQTVHVNNGKAELITNFDYINDILLKKQYNY
ncbi:MAG: type I methionyl aminopeptidase [Bacteroides sp.]|nr:MAG: type I methionyl aminopeptidase [Bacteroides sp.]